MGAGIPDWLVRINSKAISISEIKASVDKSRKQRDVNPDKYGFSYLEEMDYELVIGWTRNGSTYLYASFYCPNDADMNRHQQLYLP